MKPAYFLMLLAFVLFYFLIELFDPFLKSISVAALLTIATNSMFLRINNQVKNRAFSTTIFTLAMTALFFLPILYCIISFATFVGLLYACSTTKKVPDREYLLTENNFEFEDTKRIN